MMKWFRDPLCHLPCTLMLTFCLGSLPTLAQTAETPDAANEPLPAGIEPDSETEQTESEPDTVKADTTDAANQEPTPDQNATQASQSPPAPQSETGANAAEIPTEGGVRAGADEPAPTPNAPPADAPKAETTDPPPPEDIPESAGEDFAEDDELAETWLEPETPGLAQEQIEEHRILAYASTVVAVLSFGAGSTIGYLARDQYDCLQNILSCNENLSAPIEGTAYLDQVAEMEQKAVLADMFLVLGVASSVVAVTNWVQGFLWTDDEQKDARAMGSDANRYAARLSGEAYR